LQISLLTLVVLVEDAEDHGVHENEFLDSVEVEPLLCGVVVRDGLEGLFDDLIHVLPQFLVAEVDIHLVFLLLGLQHRILQKVVLKLFVLEPSENHACVLVVHELQIDVVRHDFAGDYQNQVFCDRIVLLDVLDGVDLDVAVDFSDQLLVEVLEQFE